MVDILLATRNRPHSLIMALAGVAGQWLKDIRLIIADQSDDSLIDDPVAQTLCRLIEVRGGQVEWHCRPPIYGTAEQRHFLLGEATADYVLYLDDDVYMEAWVVTTLLEMIQRERCAFIGAFPVALSHRYDVRPHQQQIEYWDGPVQPEIIEPGSPQWERRSLHLAANLFHIAQTFQPGEFQLYKVAWIPACVLYDRGKLLQVGGFSFWHKLPRHHAGEQLLVQNLLMRRWGGCGLVPSGTYDSQAETTPLAEEDTVEENALDLLPEMSQRYVPVKGPKETE